MNPVTVASTMTMATKQDIINEHRTAYRKGDKQEKGRILDVIASITGLQRKAIIQRFRRPERPRGSGKRRGGCRIYGPDVTAALREIWQLENEICGERLKPQIAECVRVLSRDGMWAHDALATRKLLEMSQGTAKRRIASFEKAKGRRRGRSATKPTDLKEIIPIRRGPWQNPDPGFGEVDTVAHCGVTLAGDYSYSVQYTDVATIWTCLAGQWNKGEMATVKSLERIKRRLPFPLAGLDPDSGSEFINWHCKGWCDEQQIALTRTRPYMKNDHARIEQKNYTNIRDFVGYSRLDHPGQVAVLNELYDALEDYINFFLPSVKCLRKERVGSKYVRVYDTARPAYRRVLEDPRVDKVIKEHLRTKYATLNPKILKTEVDRLTRKLSSLRPPHYDQLR